MERIKLTEQLGISRIVHGHWRLMDWNLSDQQLLKLTEQVIELGITTFDHADIYGNYSCERRFGETLRLKKELRPNIEIITKCGIKLLSAKFPERKLKHYDYSFDHIVSSVETSLANFNTDYIDLLLLHRPAPFFEPEVVAEAFAYLKKTGKVLHFGVSNFTPLQFEMLNAFLDEPLATNQVELSPWCLDHFDNGNIDFFLKKKIRPMAWSPLAGGRMFNPRDEKGETLNRALWEVAAELNLDAIDSVVYAWLLNHPAGIIPIAGTRNIDRLKGVAGAIGTTMSPEQWYKIYTASTGKDLP